MDRRTFTSLLPALLTANAFVPETAEAETLSTIASGVFKPKPATATGPRVSQGVLAGLLKAGNLRLEIHETTQQIGAPHEPIGTHLHNEIWLVREGTVELTTNGIARLLSAGDVGICIAGDEHFIRNAGETVAKYFVVAVGPPE